MHTVVRIANRNGKEKGNEKYESELTKTFKYVSSIPNKIVMVSRSSLTSNSNAEFDCQKLVIKAFAFC